MAESRELRTVNTEQIVTAVRWIAGLGGAYLAARGYLTKEQVSSVTDTAVIAIPALVALASAIYGIIKSSDANRVASAASVPAVTAVVTTSEVANDTLKSDPKVLDAKDASAMMMRTANPIG
jgi:hypothetical protein